MRRLILDHALLPEGWAKNVGIDIESGTITVVHPNASAEGRERITGIALPGLPNLHSHTFQRGMAGLAETRGPEGDSFWTWRQVMYRFLGSLTPDDVEAIAAFAMMEMLEGGFTALAEDLEDLVKQPQTREPRNLLAVVEDTKGVRYYRFSVEEGLGEPWRTMSTERANTSGGIRFDQLGEVRIVSEGLS